MRHILFAGMIIVIGGIMIKGYAGTGALAAQDAVAGGNSATVRFATAWSTNADPAQAGKEATEKAIQALGCTAKGIVFYTYYTKAKSARPAEVVPDVNKERAAAGAVAQAAAGVPSIGCRAEALVNGGTLLRDEIAVLAIGGEKASCRAISAEILDDRRATGERIAAGLKDVKDLKLVIALAEMRLSFEAKEGVSVEDFIRGVIDNSPKGTVLFGGNSMNSPDNPAGQELAGAQFYNGQALSGHVVGLGIGGPLSVFANHTNEFSVSKQTAVVTKAQDKWVITLDGRPAAEVYREFRGMKPDEKFTSDWQHPVGVIVAPGKVYLRMILNWVNADGKDKDGNPTGLPAGSLRFVAPIVEGTKIKILKGGDDPASILASAGQGVRESLRDAQKAGIRPALALLSNCCARGMRLRTFRKGSEDEIPGAIGPVLKGRIPIFGFYAYGELGPIRGQYQGLKVQYQQHTFVSAVVGIKEK